MEEFKENPSQIDSSRVMNVLKTIKKRKFLDEQLGLPMPKHKCWERIFPSDKPVSMFDEIPEVKNMQTHAMQGKVKEVTMDGWSEPESGKGSNSFTESSDSSMSIFVENKLEPVYARTYLYDRPSTSNVNCISNTTEELRYAKGEHQLAYPDGEVQEIQEFQNLEDHLQEFGNQVDYIFSEYGDDCIKQCTDKEIEDVVYSNDLNPNTYLLSSGRWSVSQDNSEAQSGCTRKPTIDQEFEQYFSTLML